MVPLSTTKDTGPSEMLPGDSQISNQPRRAEASQDQKVDPMPITSTMDNNHNRSETMHPQPSRSTLISLDSSNEHHSFNNEKHEFNSSSITASDSTALNEKDSISREKLNSLPQSPEAAHLRPGNPFDDNNGIEGPFDEKLQQQISNPFSDKYVFGEPDSEKVKLENQINLAQRRNKRLTPPNWLSRTGQILGYLLMACVVYFFFIGWPLWHGAIYNFWFAYKDHLHVKAGVVIFIAVALLYALAPLTITFEKPPVVDEQWFEANRSKAAETAVIIPCYKSESIIQHTLECALKTFPAQNIFVIANGNSDTPLDNTGDVCERMGVRHIYVPIGSKISAQYVGTAAAYRFKYCLLIDDDVALPDVFPVVSERIECGKEGETHGHAKVKCIGYTLEATDEAGEPGNLCQQSQNLEYKMSGLTRTFFGKLGSASFPHGAICLWERSFLELCFQKHPGHRISEDWFFGLMCRKLGGRIKFCSQVFVKTAVPAKVVFGDKSNRAGYGELTVTSQRLGRWNFFLMARIFFNSWYLLFDWRLRQYEFATKFAVFQELYNTLLMFFFPFIWPVAVGVDPGFTIGITFAVTFMYMIVTSIFLEYHLRIRGEMVARKTVYLYYPLYKLWLRLVNIASCFFALWNYARYFSQRHPKVTDNEKLLQYMLSIVSPTAASNDRIEDIA